MVDLEPTQFADLRHDMVEQIARLAAASAEQTGCPELSREVMAAMADVPRHVFVPTDLRSLAYLDTPLPIGFDKTISQPFIVALMTELLQVEREHRVLEVGAGLGYQSAVLARLAGKIYALEIIEELARGAARRIREMGIGNVELGVGDGSHGWAEHAPYDRILVAAAPELIPPALLAQLAPGGRMVIPAGIAGAQQLYLVQRDTQGYTTTEEVLPVRFSELVGEP